MSSVQKLGAHPELVTTACTLFHPAMLACLPPHPKPETTSGSVDTLWVVIPLRHAHLVMVLSFKHATKADGDTALRTRFLAGIHMS